MKMLRSPAPAPCVALLVALATVLEACGRESGPSAGPAAASKPGSNLGFDAADIDKTVRPQDDFWRYANGKWLDRTEIPADWASYGIFQMAVDRTEGQLRDLIEAAAKGKAPAGSDARKMGDVYASYMDEARLESLALKPLDDDLAAIAALKTHDDVIAYMATAMAQGIQVPVAFDVDADALAPDHYLAYFWQDGLGLPDRDYYLRDDPALAKVRDAYGAHIQRMFELAGWPRPEAAAAIIVALEYRLADKQWTAVENRDDERIYRSQFDLDKATDLSPGFNWRVFLRKSGCGDPEKFVLAQTDYFAALGELIRETPVRHWQTYLRFKVLKSYAPYLNAAIANEDFAFQGGVLRGQKEMKPRWQRAVRLASDGLGDIVGKAYADKYFPPASRQRVERLVASLSTAFGQSIDNVAWMSPETKQAAGQKLSMFRAKIGYPDKWKDYSSVSIAPDDLVGNVRHMRTFAHAYQTAKLGQPVDRDEWLTTPQTVNAYYNATQNSITFPAAILQPPFFDPDADDAYNYGAIGATIGHEFSHGFDDQGRKFDGSGRLRDWWTAKDAAEYNDRAAKLITQFDAYSPLPDQHINGKLTLGENIADLAGLVMAYRAYRNTLGGKAPPTIGGFTGDQRFFLGYAVSWRGKERPEALREQLLSDPHAPDQFRLTGTVRNVPEFYAAFGVQPADAMYLAPEERAEIW